jgi:Flp pilus assembly protein TadD
MNRLFISTVLALSLAQGARGVPGGAQDPLADAQRDYNAGGYTRAVDTLTKAIAQSPDDARLHFLLGQSYYQLREFTRAAADLERAVQLSPKESEYHDWLGKS